jgi:hypothetical protein
LSDSRRTPPLGRGGYGEVVATQETISPLAVATIARWWKLSLERLALEIHRRA